MLGSNLSLGTSRLISSSKSEAAPSNKILGNNPPVSYADSPLYTKGPLVRAAQNCPLLGIHGVTPKDSTAPAVGTKRRKQCVSTPPLIKIRAEYQCEHVLHRFVKSL